MVDYGLQDRVVLITGANHGIGAATAKAFGREGARVFLTYLRLAPEQGKLGSFEAARSLPPGQELSRLYQSLSADWVVAAIREEGGRAEAMEADLTDWAEIPRLFDRAEESLGPVEVLVNNAAYCQPDTFLPSTTGQFDARDGETRTISAAGHDQHFAVNCRAPAMLIAEYARRHVARASCWGRIVNVSTDGASGFPGEVSYGASKHAMESFGRAAADELGAYGVTSNTIALGPVQTGWVSLELEERLRPIIPLGRIGQPEDVAEVVLFLASRQAGWITGQLLYVGGGHVMPL